MTSNTTLSSPSVPTTHPIAQFFGKLLGSLVARVALGVLALAVAVGVAEWKAANRKAKIVETQRQIDLVAEEYAKELDEKGLFVRKELSDLKDAWGQPCVIRYHTEILNDDLAITSPGPDAVLGSWDDLTVHRKTPLGKGQTAAKLVEKMVDVSQVTKKLVTK
jgi:hypothetical protein